MHPGPNAITCSHRQPPKKRGSCLQPCTGEGHAVNCICRTCGEGARGGKKGEKDVERGEEVKVIMCKIAEQHLSALAGYHTSLCLTHFHQSGPPVGKYVCAGCAQVWEQTYRKKEKGGGLQSLHTFT